VGRLTEEELAIYIYPKVRAPIHGSNAGERHILNFRNRNLHRMITTPRGGQDLSGGERAGALAAERLNDAMENPKQYNVV